MITTIQPTFCRFCLKNYTVSDYEPYHLEPRCDCEEKYEQVMSLLKGDIEQHG